MEKEIQEVTKEMLDEWATNPNGPVALHLRQKLVPVEGDGGVIFPPTYAKVGYNIDTLSDGKKVAIIDSVGSQANRMEPLFKEPPLANLVPQIEIKVGEDISLSIFDVGHRLGDALIRSTDLSEEAKKAFEEWEKGDALTLAKLAPTSIVFGAWDSRDTQAKVPRIVQSVIRAWDVEMLHRSATYKPPVDYAKLDIFSEEDKEKAKDDPKSPLAKRGFVHVPSVNTPGGVIARGPIYRDITVNLVALRQIRSPDEKKRNVLRKYILGLSLAAATRPIDGFLRQGCLLTLDPDVEHTWVTVMRDGTRIPIQLDDKVVLEYAKEAARTFGVGGPRTATFDKEKARKDSQKDKEKKKKKE